MTSTDHGVSGARASRPQFDRALDALIDGDTLVQNMLAFADELRGRGGGPRVLNLGGGDVDTATPRVASSLKANQAITERRQRAIKSTGLAASVLTSSWGMP
jgi:DNA invertase Pin-like site-specific DNA recombinase